MQFVILGYDGTDAEAPARRSAARDAHLAGLSDLKNSGHILYGAALLDKDEKMIGSMIVCEFSSKEELNQWLEKEPYVLSGVWKTVEICPAKVPQLFSSHQPVA